MAIHVIKKYPKETTKMPLGGQYPFAIPWRILTVAVAGACGLEITLSEPPFEFTLLSGNYNDERVLPTPANPFPIALGGSVVTLEVTDPVDCAIYIVYEDGIG